jgi:hypothetical protein
MNTQFMHSAILVAPALSLPVFARAGWISKYGLPVMVDVGFDSAEVVAGDDSSAGMTTSLGGTPFEYGSETASSMEVRQLAWLPRTGGPAGGWVENPLEANRCGSMMVLETLQLISTSIMITDSVHRMPTTGTATSVIKATLFPSSLTDARQSWMTSRHLRSFTTGISISSLLLTTGIV